MGARRGHKKRRREGKHHDGEPKKDEVFESPARNDDAAIYIVLHSTHPKLRSHCDYFFQRR